LTAIRQPFCRKRDLKGTGHPYEKNLLICGTVPLERIQSAFH
jgi:hypothetical protein